MKYSDPIRKITFFFVLFSFLKLDRPQPYNVMLYNGCVKNKVFILKEEKILLENAF